MEGPKSAPSSPRKWSDPTDTPTGQNLREFWMSLNQKPQNRPQKVLASEPQPVSSRLEENLVASSDRGALLEAHR